MLPRILPRTKQRSAHVCPCQKVTVDAKRFNLHCGRFYNPDVAGRELACEKLSCGFQIPFFKLVIVTVAFHVFNIVLQYTEKLHIFLIITFLKSLINITLMKK